jgi:hypothetical protein
MGRVQTNGFRGSAAFFALLLAATPGVMAGDAVSQDGPSHEGAGAMTDAQGISSFASERQHADGLKSSGASKFSRRRSPFLTLKTGWTLSA